jgi:dTDP-4-amino-4,6-dideoxygalactose transaminase
MKREAAAASTTYRIPFNKPFLTGNETRYIRAAVKSGKISGDGLFTQRCCDFFQSRYGFLRTFLTTSCTDALEMAAMLCNIKPGDEVIAPTYTFVSTVNAFVLRGARIIFADSQSDSPNIDSGSLEELVTPHTRVVVPVHYGGVACDMDRISDIARRHDLFIVEDAAQSVDSYFKGRPLGSIGHFGAFSFHETKNVIAGEGGMLAVNDGRFVKRAEIVREKGTNRSAFFRGEVDKYGWVDIGSSFLPSDIIAAFLLAQLENLDRIQEKRKQLWQRYHDGLVDLGRSGIATLPSMPQYATNNAHIFYLVCRNLEERRRLIAHLKSRGVLAVFHYQSLHRSRFFEGQHDGRALPNADRYSDCLVRLPMYFELSPQEVDEVVGLIREAFGV